MCYTKKMILENRQLTICEIIDVYRRRQTSIIIIYELTASVAQIRVRKLRTCMLDYNFKLKSLIGFVKN